MIPKTVLFPLHYEQSASELNPAIELCRSVDAHLSVLLVALAPPPPVAVDTVILSDTWATQADEIRRALRGRGDEVQRHLMESGVSAEVKRSLMVETSIETAIAEHAFFTDVTFVARTLPERADLGHHVAAGVLFGAGKPLVVANPSELGTLDWKTIVVAWDNEKPAVRAIAEAIPMLKTAQTVHILSIDPQATRVADGEAPGWDLATYLSRHGVQATVHTQPSGRNPVADVIADFAEDVGADGLVTGAYGHSRLRQRFLGGTTRSLLEEGKLPVLMAH